MAFFVLKKYLEPGGVKADETFTPNLLKGKVIAKKPRKIGG
ncbi:hypothetical protein PE36_05023 [Moritella sp. PE36]|nr:hypothetical protein PE36_05023 [Moritella sp. PE36]